MTAIDTQTPCPCGSKRLFSQCCERYLLGNAFPSTAQALMRSRYAAFVVGNYTYLGDTYHPDTREGFDSLKASQEMADIQWRSLRIINCERGGEKDDSGYVSFAANYELGPQTFRLQERSFFKKHDGRWYYVDGTSNLSHQAKKVSTIGRNDPCACGSGKKYKRCCGG